MCVGCVVATHLGPHVRSLVTERTGWHCCCRGDTCGCLGGGVEAWHERDGGWDRASLCLLTLLLLIFIVVIIVIVCVSLNQSTHQPIKTQVSTPSLDVT